MDSKFYSINSFGCSPSEMSLSLRFLLQVWSSASFLMDWLARRITITIYMSWCITTASILHYVNFTVIRLGGAPALCLFLCLCVYTWFLSQLMMALVLCFLVRRGLTMNFVYSSTWPLGSRIRRLLGSSPVRLRTPTTLHGVESLDSENTP